MFLPELMYAMNIFYLQNITFHYIKFYHLNAITNESMALNVIGHINIP